MKISKHLIFLSFAAALCHVGGMYAMDNDQVAVNLRVQLDNLSFLRDEKKRENVLYDIIAAWNPITHPELANDIREAIMRSLDPMFSPCAKVHNAFEARKLEIRKPDAPEQKISEDANYKAALKLRGDIFRIGFQHDEKQRENAVQAIIAEWNPIANPEIETEIRAAIVRLVSVNRVNIVFNALEAKKLEVRKPDAKAQKISNDTAAQRKAFADALKKSNSIGSRIQRFAWDGQRKIATISIAALIGVGLYMKYKGSELNLKGRIKAFNNYMRTKLGMTKTA